MHDGEIVADPDLVRRLLTAQFPHWASLPLEPVPSAGTDNAIYRLGADMLVRLPRIGWSVDQVAKEQEWLPRIAPHLPLEIPTPLGKGVPAERYPWPWSIYTWLDGENATGDHLDHRELAISLARFVIALQAIDATGGPAPGDHNFGRGVPLADRDEETRESIAASAGLVDIDAVTAAWDQALRTPPWPGPPVWVHGDLQAGNLLVSQGKLTGVIDFGGLGVGDPACDLLVAWNTFSGEAREAFRAEFGVDDETWARGRGWALSVAMIQLPYYVHTSLTITANARYVIAEVLAEHETAH